MAIIGIFFGSDSNNTETVAKLIQKEFGGADAAQVFDISKTVKEDFKDFDILLLGTSTRGYGNIQSDWDDFLPTLKEIDLKNKSVGLFGCGDQGEYPDHFCNGMKSLYDVVVSSGGEIIGYWPSEDYCFEKSDAALDESKFVGLVIDEDRQPEKTDERIKQWVKQIKGEMNLEIFSNKRI